MKRPSVKGFSLSPAVLEILRTLWENGFRAYVVGGAVRDLLRGIRVSDWDLATDAPPDRLIEIFPKAIPTGIRHGTVTVRCGTSTCEVTTFRTDRDDASRHGHRQSSVTERIEEDLSHRDFTINAMAYDPLSERLIDPFGGRKDLGRGIVRGVENPLSRFIEDGLRPYRAIRFSVTLNYLVERRTWAAIPQALDQVRDTSWERVRDEIVKMLEARSPSRAFEMMRQSGLLAIAMPELLEGYRKSQGPSGDIYHHLLDTADAAPRRPMLRLACILHDIGKARVRRRIKGGYAFENHETVSAQMADAVTARLRLSNRQKKYIHQLVENHRLLAERPATAQATRRLLSRIDPVFLDDLFHLRLASTKASGAHPSEIRRLYRIRTTSKRILASGLPLTISQLTIDGERVKEILGIREGVRIGTILTRLLDAVLEDPSKNNPRDLASLVRNLAET